MFILSKNQDVVIFGPLRVWAENGFVCIEDSRVLRGKEGGFTQLHPRKALAHLKGINDMLGNRTNSMTRFSDEWERHMRFIEDVQPIIRKAFEQGTHDDKSAQRDREIRRKKTFMIPASTENWD